jgi:hypothetical protein
VTSGCFATKTILQVIELSCNPHFYRCIFRTLLVCVQRAGSSFVQTGSLLFGPADAFPSPRDDAQDDSSVSGGSACMHRCQVRSRKGGRPHRPSHCQQQHCTAENLAHIFQRSCAGPVSRGEVSKGPPHLLLPGPTLQAVAAWDGAGHLQHGRPSPDGAPDRPRRRACPRRLPPS